MADGDRPPTLEELQAQLAAKDDDVHRLREINRAETATRVAAQLGLPDAVGELLKNVPRDEIEAKAQAIAQAFSSTGPAVQQPRESESTSQEGRQSTSPEEQQQASPQAPQQGPEVHEARNIQELMAALSRGEREAFMDRRASLEARQQEDAERVSGARSIQDIIRLQSELQAARYAARHAD